ncbi:hypothetical protein GCM10018966_101260 [Streptomyces yanii]
MSFTSRVSVSRRRASACPGYRPCGHAQQLDLGERPGIAQPSRLPGQVPYERADDHRHPPAVPWDGAAVALPGCIRDDAGAVGSGLVMVGLSQK